MVLRRSYHRSAAPVTTEVVEAVLWLVCGSRSDLYSSNVDANIYSVLLEQVLGVLSSGHGLDDLETVHAFCQLLDRYKVRTESCG